MDLAQENHIARPQQSARRPPLSSPRGPRGCDLRPHLACSAKRKQIPPTFLPPPISRSSTSGLSDEENCALWGSLVWPLALTRLEPKGRPAQNECQWQGGSLYLSCHCLMYTHPHYLLPNKRNTSVLPTETVQALALRVSQGLETLLKAAENRGAQHRGYLSSE